MTVAVVGHGAVGLLGVLAASRLGAERIIAMSRHEPRQKLARHFGATDIVTERGDEGVARVKDMTGGIGADAVLECVGTSQSMSQALAVPHPKTNHKLARPATIAAETTRITGTCTDAKLNLARSETVDKRVIKMSPTPVIWSDADCRTW